MAEWVRFVRNCDYRHKSRATTAYKAGMVIYAPNEIARSVLASGHAVKTGKPDERPSYNAAGYGGRVYLEDGEK
jgi:hypothetical protein